MVPRERRASIPATMFERVLAMAIERGKLGDMLIDQTDGWSAHALARVLHVFEQTPVAKAMVAIEPLRSTFLRAMVSGMRTRTDSVG